MSIKRKIFIATFLTILVVLVPGYLSTVASADDSTNATIYLSLVDDAFGFYKIRNLEPIPRQFTYDDHVLNINVGDTIIWENDADISTLTVVSDQNLWNDKIGRIKVGQKVNYKFDKPGTYTFHLREVSSKIQTIVVNNMGGMPTSVQTPTATVVGYSTPVPTTTYKPSYTATNVPTPTSTIAQNVTAIPETPKYTPAQTSTYTVLDIKIPTKITPTSFASVIVGILSIYITFRRKN